MKNYIFTTAQGRPVFDSSGKGIFMILPAALHFHNPQVREYRVSNITPKKRKL